MYYACRWEDLRLLQILDNPHSEKMIGQICGIHPDFDMEKGEPWSHLIKHFRAKNLYYTQLMEICFLFL